MNTDPRLENLMGIYQDLKVQADHIKTQMDKVKAEIGELMPDGGEILGHRVSLVRGRVAWQKVADDFPQTTFPQLYQAVTQLNTREAEKQIAPATLDLYRGKPSVSIK